MKHINSIILILLSAASFGQNNFRTEDLPKLYKSGYAIISVKDLKNYYEVIEDLKLDSSFYLFLPIDKIIEFEEIYIKNSEKEPNLSIEKKNSLTIDEKYFDSLKKYQCKESFLLGSETNTIFYHFLTYYTMKQLFLNHHIIIVEIANSFYKENKYRKVRIGAWSYFKFKREKDSFFVIYVAKGTGSIYQSCINGRSTMLGKIIMFFQRIIYKCV